MTGALGSYVATLLVYLGVNAIAKFDDRDKAGLEEFVRILTAVL